MARPRTITLVVVAGLATAVEARVQVNSTIKQGAEDLVGYWRFDDVTGTRHFRDDSAYNNLMVSRRGEYAYQYAEAIPESGLGGSGGIRFWSRSSASATGVPAFKAISFWIKRDMGCCKRVQALVKAKIDGKPFFDMWVAWSWLYAQMGGNAKTKTQVKWPVAVDGAGWDHIAVVLAGSGEKQEAQAFLNGKLKAKKKAQELKDQTGKLVELQIGTGWKFNEFVGVMDEIRLYNRELSQEEVAALAAAYATGGVPAGENLPPIANPGPVITVWKSTPSGVLEGTCTDPEGTAVTASWQVKSGPDPAAISITTPSSANTPFSLAATAPTGDYVVTLTCSDGALTRSADLAFVVFEAHEDKVGQTIETLGPNGPFADAGKVATPKGLWLFDGDLSNKAPGGQEAKLVQLSKWRSASSEFVAEGRFGGALSLECSFGKCVQLDLGNAEDAPWPAITVSVWFKATKFHNLNGVMLAKKGALDMPSKFFRGMKPNTWHHFVLMQDGDIRKLYLDGSIAAPIRHGVKERNAEEDAADILSFGIRPGDSYSRGFSGLVDEIAVYDYILSNEEVELLYTTGAQSFTVRGTQNPYSRIEFNTTMMSFFPDLHDTPDYTGFVLGATPTTDSPKAYVHPRIFFTPEELPAVRKRYMNTVAGRTMMENLRTLTESLFREEYTWWKTERNATEEEFYHPWMLKPVKSGIDTLLIVESFRALIDGDSAAAVRVGQQLDALADFIQKNVEAYIETWRKKNKDWSITAVDGINYDNTAWWTLDVSQDGVHQLMGRGVTVAYCYDFVYPWLQPGTRDKLRKAIATATQGVWSLGMDSIQAHPALGTNWLPWVTGDLAMTILAIEGEDGFDKGVYDRAAKTMLGFELLGVSAVSGAPYAGMGKNCIVTDKLMALAKHGYPNIIAGSGVKKHGTKWLLHSMLPNGRFWKEDMWGSVELKPAPGDITGMKHAFPDDKVIDYVWRRGSSGFQYAGMGMDYGGGDGMMPYRQLAPWPNRYHVYGYDILADLIYVQDWTGPKDMREHGELATAGEPLTYVASDTGQLFTRSAWADEDAAWMLFNVRTLPGDHASRARGEFVFHANGETWAFYHTDWNEPGEMHATILVDDKKGQARWVPGRFVQYQDSPQATFGSCDVRHNYGIEQFGGGFGRQTVNEFMIEPLPYPWGDLTWNQMPNWYDGNGPDLPNMKANGELSDPPTEAYTSMYKPYVIDKDPGMFVKAYRTVGMVRSENPYCLVLDDIQKDDKEHAYAWRMPVRDDYYKFDPATGLHQVEYVDHDYFKADGNDFILRSTDGGKGRMLVRLLPSSSKLKSANIVVGEGAPNPGRNMLKPKGCSLEVVAEKATDARFRMLLWPLADEDSPLPTTTWDEASSTLTINDDQIVLSVTAAGATMVQSLTSQGTPVSFTTNSISSGPAAGVSAVQKKAKATKAKDSQSASREMNSLDSKYLEIEREFESQVQKLRANYSQQQKQLLEQRAEILQGQDGNRHTGTPAVKGFWLEALGNHPTFESLIEEWDAPVLEYMRDVTQTPLDAKDPSKGFKLRFEFAPNPYFKEKFLSKAYRTKEKSPYSNELSTTQIVASKISWEAGKDVTTKVVPKANGGVAKTEPRSSFFRAFFKSSKETGPVPEDLEFEMVSESRSRFDDDSLVDDDRLMKLIMDSDHAAGRAIRDSIIPYASKWYAGEAGIPEANHDDDDKDDDEDEFVETDEL